MIFLIFCPLCRVCLSDMTDLFGHLGKGRVIRYFWLFTYHAIYTHDRWREARIQRLIPIIHTYKAYIIMKINSAKKASSPDTCVAQNLTDQLFTCVIVTPS